MAENFFRRWSRRKSGGITDDGAGVPAANGRMPESPPPLTIDDIASLRADADFSSFMAGGVDKTVRRAALKKMFSDPHFNIMDGLDIYIGDYNKPSPVSATMLAALAHSRSTLFPRPLYEKTVEDGGMAEGGRPADESPVPDRDMTDLPEQSLIPIEDGRDDADGPQQHAAQEEQADDHREGLQKPENTANADRPDNTMTRA